MKTLTNKKTQSNIRQTNRSYNYTFLAQTRKNLSNPTLPPDNTKKPRMEQIN